MKMKRKMCGDMITLLLKQCSTEEERVRKRFPKYTVCKMVSSHKYVWKKNICLHVLYSKSLAIYSSIYIYLKIFQEHDSVSHRTI